MLRRQESCIFLIVLFGLTLSFKIPPQLRLKPIIRLSESASTDNSDNSKNASSSKNPFIDMFAAGARQAPVQPSKPAFALDTGTVTQVPTSNKPGTATEVRVELLRLEAEKEQLAIDQIRLEEDKKKLIELDIFIAQLMDSNERTSATYLEKIILDKPVFIKKELFFRLAELANAAAADEKDVVNQLSIYIPPFYLFIILLFAHLTVFGCQ